jgi:hypothetical protein
LRVWTGQGYEKTLLIPPNIGWAIYSLEQVPKEKGHLPLPESLLQVDQAAAESSYSQSLGRNSRPSGKEEPSFKLAFFLPDAKAALKHSFAISLMAIGFVIGPGALSNILASAMLAL